MEKTKLEELKEKYRLECLKNKDTLTYRGLLGWLSDKGLNIEYFEGLDLKLLDFNNEVFNEVENE